MIMVCFEDVFLSMVYFKLKILLYLVYKVCVLVECNRIIGLLKLLYIEFVEIVFKFGFKILGV